MKLLKVLLPLIILVCTQTHVWALNNQPAVQEDVVLQWNRVLMETILTPGQHPATIMPVRSYAIMHAAMFDAVNSVEGSHTPYLTEVPGSENASLEAAAAQAAHDVLVGLYPTRAAVFDAELIASLQAIIDYRAQQGIRVGKIVAERMLAAVPAMVGTYRLRRTYCRQQRATGNRFRLRMRRRHSRTIRL
jgi:hypothetical protein